MSAQAQETIAADYTTAAFRRNMADAIQHIVGDGV
jgi:hypothetical protein